MHDDIMGEADFQKALAHIDKVNREEWEQRKQRQKEKNDEVYPLDTMRKQTPGVGGADV